MECDHKLIIWRRRLDFCARMSQETVAAQDMIARFAKGQGREPRRRLSSGVSGDGAWASDETTVVINRRVAKIRML
jgi:hypothetical protein